MRASWQAAFAATIAALMPISVLAEIVPQSGPWDARFVAGGIGIERELPADTTLMAAAAAYTISGWVRLDRIAPGVVILSMGGGTRMLSIAAGGRLELTTGETIARSAAALAPARWTHVAVTVAGARARFFLDGRPAGEGSAEAVATGRKFALAPVVAGRPHLSATLVGFGIDDRALGVADVVAAARARPDFAAAHIWEVGRGWEFQKTANTGYWRPQDPWTLPKAKAAPRAPVAVVPVARPALEAIAAGRWQVNGWALAAAPGIASGGALLSRPGKPAGGPWYAATVPGTVLKTLVDRGIYPDPYYGLDNMAIPESLARQDYWYRTEFAVPADATGKRATLVLNGVNYASEIWINGARAGSTKGAFIRGRFAFTPVSGINAVAIRVSPPPHPGTPHEESIAAGPGENGGQLAIDGPTFVDTEGWDWIPGIRDRNTGLWQPVELDATGALEIGDPHVVTDLPLPRTDSADIHVDVPVTNHGDAARDASITVAFDDGTVTQRRTIAPGETATLSFSPATDPALRVRNPKLWWPNGYGEPALHRMTITAADTDGISDMHSLRFGIREISYDLPLMRGDGALKRVNVQTTDGGLAGTRLIDVRHEAIWNTPRGFVESLTAAGEASPAVTPVPDYDIPEPHLAIRVNGVKIAARGGNWGMDDAMKQIARARLEPYFRLERDAGLNVIRNWMGTNTEPVFYDLADEYGMMILNDFWQSTQNFQIEPEDPQLFLANARDVIARYRNHPSIVLWFGRNEGVPYPKLNEGLDDAVFELDGTRWYTGSSNVVNLQYSGPYNYRPAEGYFTDLATGFSVETGGPSLATLESIEATVPPADRWPISDTLAYHDWHFGGNGDVKTFMATLAERFGAGTSLADFERKAQMMNVETYKAMYEGMAAHLWTKNTGRLLWMTHPSWPSNHWQVYSWDYDTHGAYYGAKAANEPLHIQLDLPDNVVAVVNTTRDAAPGLTADTRVVALDGREIWRRREPVAAGANTATHLAPVPLDTLFTADPMLLVVQRLVRADGTLVSRNLYWRGKDQAAYRALTRLAPVTLDATIAAASGGDGMRAAKVILRNGSATPALNAKLTLVDAAGGRILPAYYSDNYVSLLPGESIAVTVDWPERTPAGAVTPATPRFTLRGWNVAVGTVR